MCYTLPKIWLGRIQKFWDKIMPTDYPASDSKFSLKFDDELKPVVTDFENNLGTENSPITAVLPENTYPSNYIGVYDVEGKPGEKTLLSPEKVSTKDVLAMHYNKETGAWEKIEGVTVEDGYVWGTLASFSPIAIVEIRKDIHAEDVNDFIGRKTIVCEGNSVEVCKNKDDKVVARNKNNGKEIEIEPGMLIVGGSINGSHVDSTDVLVNGVEDTTLSVCAGSIFYSAEEGAAPAVVESAKVKVVGSTIRSVTGSALMVRTRSLSETIKDSTIKSHIGTGECWSDVLKKDVNDKYSNYGSLHTLKNATIDLSNTKAELVFAGGNSGFTFTDTVNISVKDGCNLDYLITGPSNGNAISVSAEVENSTVEIYQSVNRGHVEYSKGHFAGSTIKALNVGSDPTDSTCTGTTGKIRIDVDAGEGNYKFALGTEAGAALTTADVARIVDAVKVSRNTTFDVSEVVSVLGDKLAIK
jgi:hypothetical protein